MMTFISFCHLCICELPRCCYLDCSCHLRIEVSLLIVIKILSFMHVYTSLLQCYCIIIFCGNNIFAYMRKCFGWLGFQIVDFITIFGRIINTWLLDKLIICALNLEKKKRIEILSI